MKLLENTFDSLQNDISYLIFRTISTNNVLYKNYSYSLLRNLLARAAKMILHWFQNLQVLNLQDKMTSIYNFHTHLY